MDFFFFSPLQSWNWQSSKKAESQNLLNHKIWKSDLWIHNFSTCQLVDPQKSLILLFKFCGSTIFGIKILWIHKILKLHLWIHKIFKINVFSKKIEENRGELSQFFFWCLKKCWNFQLNLMIFPMAPVLQNPIPFLCFLFFFRFPIESIFWLFSMIIFGR